MIEALIALGGNVGSVRNTFDRAVTLLCDGSDVALLARSSDYQTAPWGDENQPDFINCCLRIATALSPQALLDRTQMIERMLGRDRSKERHWGPRPIDIDILAYDELTVDEPRLKLPHPRLFERAFVLVPLAEIAPTCAVTGIRIRDALDKLDVHGIAKLAPPIPGIPTDR